jgi:hypothetical protein
MEEKIKLQVSGEMVIFFPMVFARKANRLEKNQGSVLKLISKC